MIKITKYGISVSILSLQDWNFAGLMYWKNYTLQYCLWCNHSNKLFIRPLPSQKILICCSNGLTDFLVLVLCDILLSLFAHTHWMNSTCKYSNTFWKRKTLILPWFWMERASSPFCCHGNATVDIRIMELCDDCNNCAQFQFYVEKSSVINHFLGF